MKKLFAILALMIAAQVVAAQGQVANYIKDRLEEFKADGIMYNEREMLFNKPRTDWSKIQELEYM